MRSWLGNGSLALYEEDKMAKRKAKLVWDGAGAVSLYVYNRIGGCIAEAWFLVTQHTMTEVMYFLRTQETRWDVLEITPETRTILQRVAA